MTTTTTLYLRNQAEIAAAKKTLRRLGYKPQIGDRYVMNIAEGLEGSDPQARKHLVSALVSAVSAVRAQ